MRDKVIHRTTKFSNFFNQTAAQETVFRRGRQEERFYFIGQGAVGMSHLQLFLEV